MLYEIAYDLYLLDIIVRDFHASELVLNRQHQLNAVEQVGSEIVREVRLTCDKLDVNAELFRNESADIVDGETLPQRRQSLERCRTTDVHDQPPMLVRARNRVQINAPGSATLMKKSWSVTSRSH
jgi:hypothetical protein